MPEPPTESHRRHPSYYDCPPEERKERAAAVLRALLAPGAEIAVVAHTTISPSGTPTVFAAYLTIIEPERGDYRSPYLETLTHEVAILLDLHYDGQVAVFHHTLRSSVTNVTIARLATRLFRDPQALSCIIL